ncbi:MAG: hypothetical protein E2O44_05450 [Nitrospina sp.]|nr:MAG: hypothetical protein E2O44_05450 [Nitrospina sp.]
MRVLSEWRRLIMAVLLGVVCLTGPLVVGEATAAEGEVGFFQKIKKNINSWLGDDSGKEKKDASKTVGKIEKSTKKNVKKTSSQGQSSGRKVLSFIKKRGRMASDNIQKSIDKDKKTLSRKFQTSSH